MIVPALPGALSALGILVSDVVKDYSRTVLWLLAGKLPAEKLDHEFSALQKLATKGFRQEAWLGKVLYQRSIDLRYRGQGYELNLPFTRNLLEVFEQEHHRRYGYAHPAREVELVTLRVRAVVKSTTADGSKTANVGTGALARPGRAKLSRLSPPKTPVQFDNKKLATAIYSRESLQPGKKHSGPAIITEYSATLVIPPRKRFHLDPAGNLVIAV